jgi:NAD(P)-dependent dehydrogenase (short-subunit alcohol dehydrogenase family)
MRTLKELYNLEGRTALVTGATGNLGKIICETISELGGSLVIIDIGDVDSLAIKISDKFNNNVTPVKLDLSDLDQINTKLPHILSSIQSLNILVNNAAFVGSSNLSGWNTSFLDQDIDSWNSAINLNLTAPFLLSKLCTPMLEKAVGSSIINISSIYGQLGPNWQLYEGTSMGNPAGYASSKAGLNQLTKWLSTTLGPKIRANSISPGGILRNQDRVFIDRYQNKVPLRRMAVEEDFKGVIAFLASDASSYVTGQDLLVDGGYSAW